MSYYSDIAIGMSLQSFKDLWEREKEYVDKKGSLLDKIDKFVHRDDDSVFIFWKDIEWYRTPLARRIEDFLQDLVNEGERSYYFIRMGEELDDIEKDWFVGKVETQKLDSIDVQRKIAIIDEKQDDKIYSLPTFNSFKEF